MSSEGESNNVFDGLSMALRKFREKTASKERRAWADALTLFGREVILALRQGEADTDTKVSDACKDSIKLLKKHFRGDLRRIEEDIASERWSLQFQSEDSSDGDDSGPAEEETSIAEVREWLIGAAKSRNGVVKGSEEKLVIALPLKGGRSQKVFADLGETDSTGESTMLMYTLCGPPHPELYAKLLKYNSHLSRAAFALIRRDGKEMIILLCRRRISGLTPSSVAINLAYIARKGDQIEEKLGFEDKY